MTVLFSELFEFRTQSYAGLAALQRKSGLPCSSLKDSSLCNEVDQRFLFHVKYFWFAFKQLLASYLLTHLNTSLKWFKSIINIRSLLHALKIYLCKRDFLKII